MNSIFNRLLSNNALCHPTDLGQVLGVQYREVVSTHWVEVRIRV